MANEDVGEAAASEENTPSSLDEISNAELRMLYQDSSAAMRFAKERQWKLLGATLLLFVGLMAVPEILSLTDQAGKALVLISFLVGAAAIYLLIIYQVWQNAELSRMRDISTTFSSMFVQLAGPQTKQEAKSHGLAVLLIMIAAILLANGLTALKLSPLFL